MEWYIYLYVFLGSIFIFIFLQLVFCIFHKPICKISDSTATNSLRFNIAKSYNLRISMKKAISTKQGKDTPIIGTITTKSEKGDKKRALKSLGFSALPFYSRFIRGQVHIVI